MDLRLYSIDQAPRTLPIWDVIREDLAWPPAPRIAKVLGVGLSTVYRWNADGRAPRVACLALFWLTRWGRSEVHTRATNDAMLAVALARSLGEERHRLREQLADLELEHRRVQHAMQQLSSLSHAKLTRHSSGTSAHPSHTDSATACWPAHHRAMPEQRPMAAPTPLPVLTPQPLDALTWPTLEPVPLAAPPRACAGPGSPAAPPRPGRSGKRPSPPRSAPPPPSSPQPAASSLPSNPPSDASVAPLWHRPAHGVAASACHLLELRQGQGQQPPGKPAPAPALLTPGGAQRAHAQGSACQGADPLGQAATLDAHAGADQVANSEHRGLNGPLTWGEAPHPGA